jgi:hypothetical protein
VGGGGGGEGRGLRALLVSYTPTTQRNTGKTHDKGSRGEEGKSIGGTIKWTTDLDLSDSGVEGRSRNRGMTPAPTLSSLLDLNASPLFSMYIVGQASQSSGSRGSVGEDSAGSPRRHTPQVGTTAHHVHLYLLT